MRPVLPVLTRKKRISRITPPPRRSSIEADLDGGLLLAVILVDRLGQVQGDAGVGGDDLGDLLNAERDRGVVVVLTGRRNHGAADVADLGVVQDAFQAIANLDAIFPWGHENSRRTPRSVPLAPTFHLSSSAVANSSMDWSLSSGLDGDDGDLGVGLAIDLGAEVFQAGFCRGRQNAGEVADIAGGSRKGAYRFGRQNNRRCEDQEDNCQPARKVAHRWSFYALHVDKVPCRRLADVEITAGMRVKVTTRATNLAD